MLRSSAKNKGRIGEIEILAMLSNMIVFEYNRRGFPVPEGGVLRRGPNGKDIVGLHWLAPEIKRHEEINAFKIEMWWQQARDQAGSGDCMPVLFFRPNHSPWRVRMLGRLNILNGAAVRCPVDITLEDFKVWFFEELKARLDGLRAAK